jgi:hypothetical protein
MAKLIKFKGLLSFRESEPDPRKEEQETKLDPAEADKPEVREFSPFQRVKRGAGDMFLASEAIPLAHAVN